MNGKTYGRWTVVCLFSSTTSGGRLYLCRCACGSERAIRLSVLQVGLSKHCGCETGPMPTIPSDQKKRRVVYPELVDLVGAMLTTREPKKLKIIHRTLIEEGGRYTYDCVRQVCLRYYKRPVRGAFTL